MAGEPVGATYYALQPLPTAPVGRVPQIRRACRYLTATHRSVTGLLDSYNLVRDKRVELQGHGAGRLSRDELDLLRAALIFTSSGLDACCQTLVLESLPVLIHRGGNAKQHFDNWLETQTRQASPAFIAAVKDHNPRSQFIALYTESKTRASYQGSNDVKDRVRALLGIPRSAIPDASLNALDGFFRARNDIVHRLDYEEPQGPSTKRHHRSPTDVVRECDAVLAVASKLIHGTAALLKSR